MDSGRRSLVALSVAGLLLCGTAWAADDASTRLKAVSASTSLETEGLQPWHLKLDVQTTAPTAATGATGAGGEKGTVEEWWSSPTMYRIVYDFPSYKGVIGHDGTGYYRSAGFAQVPLQIELARRQVTHPTPTERELFDYNVDLRKNDFGTGMLECLVVSRPKLHEPFPPFGEFPAYCLKTGSDELMLTLGYGREFIPRSTLGTFQKKTIVTAVVAKQNGQPAVAARVAKLEVLPAIVPGDYAAPDGAEHMAEPELVAASAAAKQIKHKVEASVPDRVAAQLVGQEYVARVLVGLDGKIEWLIPVSASSPVLARPCEVAMRQFTFKPFLAEGKPVEAMTTVTIAY